MEAKKRRWEDAEDSKDPQITEEDAMKLMEALSREQVVQVLKHAVVKHPDVLQELRNIVDKDITKRKLFVRGLGNETTEESIRSVFGQHGEIEDLNIIIDKPSGKNKGYCFITYAHVDSAMDALKEPSKKIDGRVTLSNLAVKGPPHQQLQQQLQQHQQQLHQLQLQQLQLQPVVPMQPILPVQSVQPVQPFQHLQSIQHLQPSQPIQSVASNPVDASLRKIYIGNVPTNMTPGKLIDFFSQYGDIEEGPIGYDTRTGKCKGFALITYKTIEAMQKAVDDPVKSIDGHQLFCKTCTDSQKQKPVATVGQINPNSNATSNIKSTSLDPSLQYSGLSHGLVNPALGVRQVAAATNSSALAAAGLSSYGLNDAALLSLSRDPTASNLTLNALQSSLGRDQLQGLVPSTARTSLGVGAYGVGAYGSSGLGSIGGASSIYGTSATSLSQSAAYEGANQYALALAQYQSQQTGASPAVRVPEGGTLPSMRSYYPS